METDLSSSNLQYFRRVALAKFKMEITDSGLKVMSDISTATFDTQAISEVGVLYMSNSTKKGLIYGKMTHFSRNCSKLYEGLLQSL